MTQTRRGSALETLAGTAIGYLVAVAANALILPAFGITTNARQNFGIAAAFTLVSLVRGYVVRRLFNALRL
jgi:hypothetical protein